MPANFNPRTPCGVRPQYALRRCCPQCISFHAPHAGCDARDLLDVSCSAQFQSTHPMRGATRRDQQRWHAQQAVQSTHPMRGATSPADAHRRGAGISIHAPHAGCDGVDSAQLDLLCGFQSTHPMRGATTYFVTIRSCRTISIHAPHAGCDGKFDDFNPLNLHKRYKRVLDRPKSTSEQGKNKAKLAYIHVFTVLGGCEGAGTVCALLLRTQYC